MSSNGANNVTLIEREWFGCYGDGWGKEVTPPSFEHPAKFSRGLIKRLYRHMMRQGYIKPGDFVVDPFGGVALGARDAILSGLHWRGMELELKFQRLGQSMDCPGFSKEYYRRYNQRGDRWNALNICPDCGVLLNKYIAFTHWFGQVKREIPHTEPHHYRGNIERWMDGPTARGTAVLLQGDSRQLAAVLGSADGCVSSPPYIGVLENHDTAENFARLKEKIVRDGNGHAGRLGFSHDGYGRSPGQLGAMPEGNHADAIDAIVSSPPFGEGETRNRSDYQPGYVSDMMSRAYLRDRQGTTPGNLAAMRADQAGFAAAIGSPPYADNGLHNNPSARDEEFFKGRTIGLHGCTDYGRSDGQLGNLKEGDFDACLSSPPYANAINGAGEGPGARHDEKFHQGDNAFKQSSQAEYGDTPGQLAAMANGGFEAALGSPPFEKSIENGRSRNPMTYKGNPETGHYKEGQVIQGGGTYGDTPGNIGNETGDTFWAAARQIVEQVYMVLRPGGYAVWVTGDFVRDKQRVYFGRQWLQLCEVVGFVSIEWIRAWKREPRGVQLDVFGNEHDKSVDRVSFFRRLSNEKNPEAAILNEDVIIMRKA